jgi:GNAT superfamily N-acetyltransferase
MRAGRVLRTEGLRALWWRGMATIAYRRVAVLLKGAELEPPQPAPAGLTIDRIGDGDVDEYRRLRPDTPEDEVWRRLGSGQICVLARLDGEPIACRWYSLGRAEVPYLGFAFELPAGLAYVHDAYTAPPVRGRGLSPPLRRHGEALLSDLGAPRFLATVVPENTAGMQLTLAAGFEPVGRLAALRLPGRRILLRKPAVRFLGPDQRIPIPWSIPAPG